MIPEKRVLGLQDVGPEALIRLTVTLYLRGEGEGGTDLEQCPK